MINKIFHLMKSSKPKIRNNKPDHLLKTMQFHNTFRPILTGLLVIAFLFVSGTIKADDENSNASQSEHKLRNKIALNAYSFNALLKKDSMDIFQLLEYCAKIGFDGVDITGYYFPAYPEVPSDAYIYSVKKRAFELGLDICGTGVRNDFCNPDPEVREKDKALIKNWIIVAEKLGAPALRILQGNKISEDHSWDELAKWAAEVIIECAEFGKEHGVVLEIQNHNNFLKTAEDVTRLLEMTDHEWVGLMLDVGSYRTKDPYHDIAETIKYAISWQLKELVYIDQAKTPVDLHKIKEIILNSEYKGYLPIETLGPGDPYKKVEQFYSEVISTLK